MVATMVNSQQYSVPVEDSSCSRGGEAFHDLTEVDPKSCLRHRSFRVAPTTPGQHPFTQPGEGSAAMPGQLELDRLILTSIQDCAQRRI